MDEFRTKKKVKRLVILVGISLLVIGVLVFVLSLLTTSKLVTPLQESENNVRIIFVTPDPSANEILIISSASPSASTKTKASATPKASSKPTPKATASSSAEVKQ